MAALHSLSEQLASRPELRYDPRTRSLYRSAIRLLRRRRRAGLAQLQRDLRLIG